MSLPVTALLALLLGLGCATAPPEGVPPRSAASTQPAAGHTTNAKGTAQPPVDVDASRPTAAVMYEQCRDRVEGRQMPSECTTDADCVATGCSGEVCLPRSMADGLVTTCEVLPCFAVLDSCGCVEGSCSWSVKDDHAAGGGIPVPLPGE